MTYKDFKDLVKEHILDYLPAEYGNAHVMIQDVAKSNDLKTSDLVVRLKNSNISPNISLEPFYNMVQNGKNMDDVLKSLADIYMDNIPGNSTLASDVKHFENVRDNLFVALMNRDMNQEHLQGAVCKDIPETDLTAAVRVLLPDFMGYESASFLVRTSLRETWGITDDELYDMALRNTVKMFPAELANMWDVMKKLQAFSNLSDDEMRQLEKAARPDNAERDIEAEKNYTLLPFERYILTNSTMRRGATVLLYPELLQKIGEATQSDFFIIPSSIHEVILMKDDGRMTAEELQRMVIDVNSTEVLREDLLSNEVYRYDCVEQKMTMVTEPSQTKELMRQMEGYFPYNAMESVNEFENGMEAGE